MIDQKYFMKVIEHFGSQSELAIKLDVKFQLVSMWANHRVNMPIKYALKIHYMTKGKFKFFKLLDEETKFYLMKK